MSDYTKITNFTAKDALSSGNPSKKILGSLFDAEFNAIATAIASKANTTSQELVTPQIQSGDASYSYDFAVGTLTADRTVTLPVLTGNDTFVFEAHTATLTNKTINLSSNTLTGTKAEFNTACSDTDFLFLNDVLDDDTFAADSAVYPASQQSIKAYGDANWGGGGGGGTVTTTGTVNAGEFAQFSAATELQALTAAETRTALSLGSLATASTINNDNWSGTDLSVANGGTGASTASAARTALGIVIGTDVQAYSATLASLASSLTASVTELNYNDITTLGTSEASKVVTANANGDVIFSEEVTIKSLNETYTTFTSTSNACTINCELGNDFQHTRTENTTLTISNPPAAGSSFSLFVRIINDAGASGYTFTWPASVKWPGGTAPTLSTGASDVDIFVLNTKDGGTTYHGQTFGQDFS